MFGSILLTQCKEIPLPSGARQKPSAIFIFMRLAARANALMGCPVTESLNHL
jgi:hypothetical protein